MEELSGRTAVVTGGGSGIGRGIALAFAAEGANVVVADIEEAAAEAVAEEVRALGVKAVGARCDVRKPESVQDLADRAFGELGGVHVICNNAGVLVNKPLLDATDADWEWIFSVNFQGVLNGIRAFVPRILAQGAGGHVVNTASLAGVAPLSNGLGVYAASKYAVVAVSEVLRDELREANVGVSVLCPGGVRTRIFESARNRPEELGGPAQESARRSGNNTSGSNVQMEPEMVGKLVVAGVKADRPYIFTHNANRTPVLERFANMIEDFAFAL